MIHQAKSNRPFGGSGFRIELCVAGSSATLTSKAASVPATSFVTAFATVHVASQRSRGASELGRPAREPLTARAADPAARRSAVASHSSRPCCECDTASLKPEKAIRVSKMEQRPARKRCKPHIVAP
jgi:hypothetical protein